MHELLYLLDHMTFQGSSPMEKERDMKMKDKQEVLATLAKSKINICDTTLRDGEQAQG